MIKVNSLTFFTSNADKARSAQDFFGSRGMRVRVRDDTIHEIQADNVESIAQHKAAQAYLRADTPIAVEDSGLFVTALRGFPGPYLKSMMTTIGPAGLLRLLEGHADRTCAMKSALVLQWSPTDSVTFSSSTIWQARNVPGTALPNGWSQLWEILEPSTTSTAPSDVYPQVFHQMADWLDKAALHDPW